MSYVTSNLLRNEQLVATERMHWILLVAPIIHMAIGIYLLSLLVDFNRASFTSIGWIFEGTPGFKNWMKQPFVLILKHWIAIPIVFGYICLWLSGLVRRILGLIGAELVITNIRVIVKHGIIRRDTVEQNRDRIESIRVQQTILGRLLNYGYVEVRGLGGEVTPFHYVCNPVSLRNKVLAQ